MEFIANFSTAQDLAASLIMQEAAPDGLGILAQLAPIFLIILVFYFLVIRPQNQQQQEHQRMIDALKRDDRVVLNSGIFGTIRAVGATEIQVEVAPKVVLRVQRGAVARLDTSSERPDKEEKADKER